MKDGGLNAFTEKIIPELKEIDELEDIHAAYLTKSEKLEGIYYSICEFSAFVC
jgi:hypothetical protein